jgi:hypothetical protein
MKPRRDSYELEAPPPPKFHESSSESSSENEDYHGKSYSTYKAPEKDFKPAYIKEDPTEFVKEIETEEERIEFQRKMQEKLQQHLAQEGKRYPPKKPVEPEVNTATGFVNDGSFLEMFKRMQEQMQSAPNTAPTHMAAVEEPVSSAHLYQIAAGTQNPIPQVPIVARRRGGKILKTGIVKKPKAIEENLVENPNDAWNLYLQEVKKYKNVSCDADSKTRPLVK